MSLNVRVGIASLDSLLSAVRVNHPTVETVVLAWDRKHRSAAVMGLLDSDSQSVEVRADAPGRLTSLLAAPMHPDVLRLAYPDADVAWSGQVVLSVPVDEPAWARVLDNVVLRVRAGMRVLTADIRSAVWATLEAADLPSGSALLVRRILFPDQPDDVVYEPVALTTHQTGAGDRAAWCDATTALTHSSVPNALTLLLNELALRFERNERPSVARGQLLLTRVIISL